MKIVTKIPHRGRSIKYVTRSLYLLSLKEWLEISLNDNFIANLK